MAIRIYKPNTPGTRNYSVSSFTEITKSYPEKSLTVPNHRVRGRNNRGVITIRHRGGGHKRRYRLIDFKRNKHDVLAKVASIESASGGGVRLLRSKMSIPSCRLSKTGGTWRKSGAATWRGPATAAAAAEFLPVEGGHQLANCV